MKIEVFEDTYWALAEIRYIAKEYLVGAGYEFQKMRQEIKDMSDFMALSFGLSPVSKQDLARYGSSMMSLAFSFAHGSMIRSHNEAALSDSMMWCSLVLEGISSQLHDSSGCDGQWGYDTSRELTEDFRKDGYIEVDFSM